MNGFMAHLTVVPFNELPAIKPRLIVFAAITGYSNARGGARVMNGEAHKLMIAARERRRRGW